jgi:hypothetical protein
MRALYLLRDINANHRIAEPTAEISVKSIAAANVNHALAASDPFCQDAVNLASAFVL